MNFVMETVRELRLRSLCGAVLGHHAAILCLFCMMIARGEILAAPPFNDSNKESLMSSLSDELADALSILPSSNQPDFRQISQTVPPPVPPAPAPPAPVSPAPTAPPQAEAADLGSGVGLGGLLVGGYLDLAAPVTQFRMRYDDALNNNFPDRGEYLYAQCGCFRDFKIDPKAQGPSGVNNSVSYQAARSYFEYAFSTQFSTFAEIPFEWMHFNTGANNGTQTLPNGLTTSSPINSSGLADINAGFKYAFIANPNEYLTFQFRTYIPTGDSYLGLGTAHVSLEPSLLYYKRLNDRWIIQGQFSELTPISVTGFASDVLQYGAGLMYVLLRNQRFTVTPTFETVGWTFLGGKQFNPNTGLQSAAGDTVLNLKPGVRVGFGNVDAPAGQQRHSLYFGFGQPVTSQSIYHELFRAEYRILF